MKKLSALICLLVLSLSAFCQDGKTPVYVRLGYSLPSWNYFEIGKSNWDSDVTRIGADFAIGTIIPVVPLGAADNMSLGLNFDVIYFNFSRFQAKNDEGEAVVDGSGDPLVDGSGEDLIGYDETVNMGILRGGTKIGPCLTYKPTDRMAFDFFAKADVAWATALVPYMKKLGDLHESYKASVSVGYATGFNIRYGKLMVGVEYDAINPKLEYANERGVYFQQLVDMMMGDDDLLIDFSEEPTGNKKSKMQNFNFTIGVCF